MALDFQNLVVAICRVDEDLAVQATRAVNTSLTLRNWLIGAHIAEFELTGADRASYGDKSPQLNGVIPSGCSFAKKVGTLSPQFPVPADQLVQKLSYSHLELIVDLDDELKRGFYTVECIRGQWSVRELKRQIGSLYFERSGLSSNKNALAELVNSGREGKTAGQRGYPALPGGENQGSGGRVELNTVCPWSQPA